MHFVRSPGPDVSYGDMTICALKVMIAPVFALNGQQMCRLQQCSD